MHRRRWIGHALRALGDCVQRACVSPGVAGQENWYVTAVGFEPTRIAPPELESGALDHSAKLS